MDALTLRVMHWLRHEFSLRSVNWLRHTIMPKGQFMTEGPFMRNAQIIAFRFQFTRFFFESQALTFPAE